jgi:dihydroflavonol-4-reductase
MTETILLTGISGFIAKHCALKLLNAGYAVRGTVRSMGRADGVRAALRPHLADPASLDRLTFVAADLGADAGWDQAVAGVDAVMHTASPFPIAQPKNPDDVIRPAVEGTLRVLKAAHAAGVRRVVMTSSTVSVLNGHNERVHTEDDWLDPATPGTTPYAKSKVMAERAAWDFVKGTGIALTVINPGLVAGPPLDGEYGSSVGLIARILKGKDPMLPAFSLPVVDVRDVAEMHLRALQRVETAGKRYLAVEGSLWMPEMAQILKAAYPSRRMPTRTAPGFVVRILGLFDAEIRSIIPQLGQMQRASNARAVAEMGMTFIPAAEAVRASGKYLVDQGLV